MEWVIAIQHWLYGGLAEAMRSADSNGGLAVLIPLAFLFGLLHAFMPGHGKSVLVSFHLARPSRLIEGVVTGALLSLTHVGMAVALVLVGVAVISRSVAAGGRAPAFDLVSAALIALIGLYLLWQSFRPTNHALHGHGKALAVVTGLVPCPLTTFILTYAFARGQLVAGLIAVGAMLAGITITITSFAVAAVIARQRLMTLMASTAEWRVRAGRALEGAGAVAVLLIGLTMLAERMGRL
jgi:ABC-type nickel/cobalt efflux system permease component RcnA